MRFYFMKNSSGFFTLLLSLFLSLMFFILMGFSLLSIGIKKSTKAQSYCLKELSLTQKQLGHKLQKLLKLNQKVELLDKTRKGLDVSIAVATATVVLIPKIPALKKSREAVKQAQKVLIAKQKTLLIQSEVLKRKQLRKLQSQLRTLKVRQTLDSSLLKKALALKKEKIGAKAYIYKPVEGFKAKQTMRVSWKLPAFKPLEKEATWFFNELAKDSLLTKTLFIKQSCAVTLEQKGEKWVYLLSY